MLGQVSSPADPSGLGCTLRCEGIGLPSRGRRGEGRRHLINWLTFKITADAIEWLSVFVLFGLVEHTLRVVQDGGGIVLLGGKGGAQSRDVHHR